jgi:glycosyltransferase involved in cell wall biosynthesis
MRVAIVGSAGQCGIHEYSRMLLEGFAQAGHEATYIGVRNKDNRDLSRQLRQLTADDRIVIIEYEPGIFDLRGLVYQLAKLRVGGKHLLLSVHEIAPTKYAEYHYVMDRVSQPVRYKGPLEFARLAYATLGVAYRFATLRLLLVVLGWLPHRVIVHSQKAKAGVRIALSDPEKLWYVPLMVQQLDGDRSAARESLSVSQDVFTFIVAGFLFRRKRIIEVIQALPPNTELYIVGTPSNYDLGYLEEIEEHLQLSPKRDQVVLVKDYDRMEDYLVAADAGVLFYSEGYQSLIASQLIGAGKPCIFSDLTAFEDLKGAGLVARDASELRDAMVAIQAPQQYQRLQERAFGLRDRLMPRNVAEMYVDAALQKRDTPPTLA